MSFRLRKDARAWFRDLRPALDLDFDMYYFCLMVGLAARNKETIQQTDTDEIVQYFPGEYGPRGRLIVAIFLKAELDGLGVKMTERTAVHEHWPMCCCSHWEASATRTATGHLSSFAEAGTAGRNHHSRCGSL